ncbi:MAG: alpha/beta fold hydrolase [Candidatus Gracilibacteria bacterium]
MMKIRSRLRTACLVFLGCLLIPLVFLICAATKFYPMILYPSPKDEGPAAPAGAALISLETDSGQAVESLYFSAKDDNPTLVYFHGNNETIKTCTDLVQKSANSGLGIAIMEYPGYGNLPGEPNEKTIYESAETLIEYLQNQGVPQEKTIIMGYSLGTGTAAEMASRNLGAKLILIAPYTSVPDVAESIVALPCMDFLIPEHFETLEKSSKIQIPTLIIHSKKDQVIPYEMGLKLSQTFPNATLITEESKGHNDYFDAATIKAIVDFACG